MGTDVGCDRSRGQTGVPGSEPDRSGDQMGRG